MRVVINGPNRDLFSFINHLLERGRRIRRSTSRPPREGVPSAIAEALHPERQKLVVTSTSSLGQDGMLFTLEPGNPAARVAPFRAGSYITVSLEDDAGRTITRPYSICSTPAESRRTNSYTIAVRAPQKSFFAARLRRELTGGTPVACSAPEGYFTYEPLRDGSNLIFIAGGSGITPFRSLVGDILENYPNAVLGLLHGAVSKEELYFSDYFNDLMKLFPGRFTWKPVLSGGVPDDTVDTGFIDHPLINEAAAGRKSSVFACGPPNLHRHIDRELEKTNFTIHRRRREDYGFSGEPSDRPTFRLEARMGGEIHHLTADPGESVLVALERGGLNPPSGCRNGTCGFCRSKLLAGTVTPIDENRGLRRADRERSYFHPCVTMPGSDMIIEIPSGSAENPSRDSL